MFKVIMRMFTSDPLKKMLIDTPTEIITKGAEDGAQKVAEYVHGTALINAPWNTGELANAQEIWRPKKVPKSRAERGVIATRRVAVNRSKIDGHYHPMAMEFGWHPHGGDEFDAGEPWLRHALKESESEAYGIYRRSMAAAIRKPHPKGRY